LNIINIILYVVINVYIIHAFQMNCKTRTNSYIVNITNNM